MATRLEGTILFPWKGCQRAPGQRLGAPGMAAAAAGAGAEAGSAGQQAGGPGLAVPAHPGQVVPSPPSPPLSPLPPGSVASRQLPAPVPLDAGKLARSLPALLRALAHALLLRGSPGPGFCRTRAAPGGHGVHLPRSEGQCRDPGPAGAPGPCRRGNGATLGHRWQTPPEGTRYDPFQSQTLSHVDLGARIGGGMLFQPHQHRSLENPVCLEWEPEGTFELRPETMLQGN
ncbi:uncharacterized protein [Notamacropus eugenii]|uniref:uncharacterized protein n=1 Tax=Notamacropus eugenii TaxID=9315 RepID=UPI003B678795